jgi:N-acetylated-alpha-linked acidic dipeptidase
LTINPAALSSLNAKLILSERKLTSEEGLPIRSWYKHQIYAPGFYTGYAVKTLPGAREAIEQKKWKAADEQLARLGSILQQEAELIESLAAEIEKGQ